MITVNKTIVQSYIEKYSKKTQLSDYGNGYLAALEAVLRGDFSTEKEVI